MSLTTEFILKPITEIITTVRVPQNVLTNLTIENDLGTFGIPALVPYVSFRNSTDATYELDLNDLTMDPDQIKRNYKKLKAFLIRERAAQLTDMIYVRDEVGSQISQFFESVCMNELSAILAPEGILERLKAGEEVKVLGNTYIQSGEIIYVTDIHGEVESFSLSHFDWEEFEKDLYCSTHVDLTNVIDIWITHALDNI